MILIFDTETTGFVKSGRPLDQQPHLVQLAAIMVGEGDGIERSSINLIIRPDGYTIPKEASDIHGIDTALATVAGVPLSVAISALTNLRALSSKVVAHNIGFDREIIDIALRRLNAKPAHPGPTLDNYICTMERSAPIVNLPPTPRMLARGMTQPKSPQLGEAYRHFFNEELEGAHDALVDVRACARIYFHLEKLKKEADDAALIAKYNKTEIDDEIPF